MVGMFVLGMVVGAFFLSVVFPSPGEMARNHCLGQGYSGEYRIGGDGRIICQELRDVEDR